MTKEISKEVKKSKCLILRGNVDIWIEEEQANQLMEFLDKSDLSQKKFFKINNHLGAQLVNVSDIVGIFSYQAIQDRDEKKIGIWECEYGNKHQKYEKCYCVNSLGYRN